jgi:DNA processing protein
MDQEERASLGLLHSINGIGNRTLWRIREEYKSFTDFLTMDASRLYKTFLVPELVDAIVSLRTQTSAAQYWDKLNNSGVKIITAEDLEYSPLLAAIHDPPFLLYYCGKIELIKSVCFAVVGSRAATVYGKNVARKMAGELAALHFSVVSGMARGIDTEAHKGALEAQGNTIAVMGSGFHNIYPSENKPLFEEICRKGLVLTEYQPATTPEPGNFPMRNRIIAGISRGVIVVEAREKSGALITADLALDQGRDVFAVPGPITSRNSAGTNNLIKQGARLLTHVDDLLEDYYDIKMTKRLTQPELAMPVLDPAETKVMDLMGYEPVHFDKLMQLTQFDIGQLSTVMLALEFKGLVKGISGNFYVKIG